MMDSNNFILTSDLATYKNDSSGTVFTVTIPSGLTYNNASPIIGTDTKTVGTINSGLRCHGYSSKYPSIISVGSLLVTDSTVNISGAGAAIATLYCTMVRVSASDLQLQVSLEGFSGGPNGTITETQTITFTVSTFLSPFD